MADPCSIYVIGPSRLKMPVKVGIAMNAMGRLEQLQCGNWIKLKLHDHMWLESPEAAYRVEYQAHKLLRTKHINGEWFRVSSAQAYDAIQAAAAKLGYHLAVWKDRFTSSLTFSEEYARYENSLIKIAPAEGNSPSEPV